MPVEHINPDTIAPPRGYSHVVKDGKTVYIAGQVARDRDGKTVGVGDARAQVDQVFKNLQASLTAAGGDLSHIVKTNIYMTHREDLPAYREVRVRYMPDANTPASTLIFCSGLADPDFRIEIEAIAIVP